MSLRSTAVRLAAASLALAGVFVTTGGAQSAPVEAAIPPPSLTLLIDGQVIRDASVITTGTTLTAVVGGLLDPGVGQRELRLDLDAATVYEAGGVTAPEGWTIEWSIDSGATWVTTEPAVAADVTSVRATASVDAGPVTSSTQRYTKALNAAVPASSFSGSTGGDGWDVFFYDNYVLNIFHHNSSFIGLDCHLRSTGARCDEFNPTDPAKSQFPGYQTANRSGGWVDGNTGFAYAFTIQSATSRPGTLCIDLNVAPPMSCGFTALSANTNVNSYGYLSNAEGIGGRLFGSESLNRQLLCFDPVTKAACTNSPVTLDGSGGAESFHVYGLGSKVFATTNTTLYCFNSADLSNCAGAWPVSYTSLGLTGDSMPPVAHMDAVGVIDGVCMWNVCLDLSGADQTSGATPAWVNPHSITPWASSPISWWGYYGKFEATAGRAFLNEVLGGSSVYCFDYATEAACDGFDTTPTTDTSLYALRADPNNPTCIWYNSDPGRIGLFDAYTGASECTANPVVTLQPSAFAPRFVCATSGGIDRWVSLRLASLNGISPTATQTLTIRTGNGDAVAGWTNVPIGVDELVDLSSLSVEQTGARPTFNVGFNLTAGTLDDVNFEIVYEGRGPEMCVDLTIDNTGADGSPNCPAIINLDASLSETVGATVTSPTPDRNIVASGDAIECPENVILATPPAPVREAAATSPTPGEGVVSFLVPLDDGGSPIRWYEYSVDGGPWLVVQSVANESGQVSFPLTGLVNGQSYAVAIRARNLLGVSATASAPLTVSVPTTTSTAPPTTTTVPPTSTPTVKASTKPGKKAAAAPVVVEATGLTPGSTYRIELATGQVLGTGVVGASGTISVTVKLPANLGAGEHEIKTVVTPPAGLPITVIDPLFIDWSGSIASEPDDAGYTARDPKRVLDTRTGSKLAANSTRTLEIGPGWNVDDGARAVAINVTATQSDGDGYVTVYPCDSDRPEASTLNLIAGSDVANMALVMAAPGDEICLYSTDATHLVVDLSGYFSTASGERMSGHGPTRVVDTRKAESLATGETLEVDVVGAGLAPETSSAVLLNVTSTRAGAAGYLTVFPCGGNAPEASNVNFEKDTDVANNVAVKVGDGGSVCIFTSAPTDVIVDLEGSFGIGGDGHLMSMVPGRVIDTRRAQSSKAPISTGAKLAAGATYEVDFVGPDMAPAATQAAVLNVTVTSGLSAGYLTVFPCGVTMPEASNVNYRSGVSVANLVTVDVGTDGKVCFYTSASIDLVVDVSGFYVSTVR